MAQPGLRIRAIKVDVSPIRASMGDPTAAWVEEALPGALAQSLAPYMAPGDRNGATLVARIDYLYLGTKQRRRRLRRLSAERKTRSTERSCSEGREALSPNVPLRAISTYFPMAVDQTLVERALQGRVTALAQAFAGWAPRELGL